MQGRAAGTPCILVALGDHLLKLRVLGLQRAKPLHIRGLEIAEALASAVPRLVTHLVLLRDLRDRGIRDARSAQYVEPRCT